MWRAVAAFELKHQLRSPVFAIVVALTALLVFGSVATERIRIGPRADGLRNGPEAILSIHGVWSLFFAFTAAAFAIEAALRDRQTGFAPVMRATPVQAGALYWGRFLGAFGTVAACFLAVPAGLLAASFAPWMDPAALGPVRPQAYLAALAAIALPNLFLLTAVMFALAAGLRSSSAAYLGAVALLIVYGLGSGRGGGFPPVLEPFGFSAVAAGQLAANRLVWTAVACAALLAGRLRVGDEAPSTLARSRKARADPPPSAAPPAAPSFGAASVRLQAWRRTVWETRAILTGWPFIVLVALGAANAGAALWTAAGAGADTRELIARLIDSFRLVPMVTAIFYAGELVWAERDARVHEITGAAPAPDWTFLLPKAGALALVLLGLLLASAATGMAVDVLRGPPGVDLRAWTVWYVLPRAYDWLLFAVLALFFQTVSPSKVAGWGWIVLHLIGQLTLESLGLNDGLYRFGGRLDGPLPDLLARDPGRGALLRTYWAALGVMLLTVALALHGRGSEPRWRGRLAQAARRFRGPLGGLAVASGLVFAVLGTMLAAG